MTRTNREGFNSRNRLTDTRIWCYRTASETQNDRIVGPKTLYPVIGLTCQITSYDTQETKEKPTKPQVSPHMERKKSQQRQNDWVTNFVVCSGPLFIAFSFGQEPSTDLTQFRVPRAYSHSYLSLALGPAANSRSHVSYHQEKSSSWLAKQDQRWRILDQGWRYENVLRLSKVHRVDTQFYESKMKIKCSLWWFNGEVVTLHPIVRLRPDRVCNH